MRIDTYSIGVRYDLDRASVRNAQRVLDRLQRQADRIRLGGDGGGGSGGSGGAGGAGGGPNIGPTIGMGMAASVAGGAVALDFFGSAIKLASDFEAKMTDANIILKGTTAQYKALSAKAKELGATTSLTATDSAAAIETLARNGVKYDQIMGGVLDSTVNLSLALKSDLAPTADLLTDVTAQFGIKAADAAKAADLLAGATVNSKFGFNDMRLAVAQAGGVAGKVGVEFNDFVTAISATSSAFSSGSDAGTSYKTFLQRLVPTTKPAAKAMEKLGLLTETGSSKFFDAAGNMRSLSEITGLLNVAFKDLSDEQKNEMASTIAGTDAMRTMLTLAGMTSLQIDNLATSIDNVSTSEMRFAKQDIFEQKVKRLQSAWEAFKLSLITPDVLEFLGQVVTRMTEIISGSKKLSTTTAGEVFGEDIRTKGIAAALKNASVIALTDKTVHDARAEQKRAALDAGTKGGAGRGVDAKEFFNLKSLPSPISSDPSKGFSPLAPVNSSVYSPQNSNNVTVNIRADGGDVEKIEGAVNRAVVNSHKGRIERRDAEATAISSFLAGY